MANPRQPELPDDLVDKHCPTCFIHYAAPRALFDKRNDEGGNWHCPNGHTIVFRQTALAKAQAEAEALRHERDQLKQNEAWFVERLDTERKEKRALKGQLTKVHKRVGNGVCPCCNRSFADLKRHMASKHAGFKAEAVAA
jgi:hypothetical protein